MHPSYENPLFYGVLVFCTHFGIYFKDIRSGNAYNFEQVKSCQNSCMHDLSHFLLQRFPRPKVTFCAIRERNATYILQRCYFALSEVPHLQDI